VILGEALRAWRTESAISLREAAVLLKIPAPTLSRIERGGVPDAHTLIKIMNWLLEPEKPKRK
jgi:transcriptional regulator with XRE-family HTH domain